MIDKQKISNNIFSNWANLGVNILISFFLAPFIVKTLGNSYYGLWVIVMQFTGYLYLLDFGVRESVIRYVSRYKEKRKTDELNEILSSAILLYGIIGFVSLLITIIIAAIYPYIFEIENIDITTIRIVTLICGITIAQAIAFNTFSGIVMGLQRYVLFNKVGIIFAIMRLILILIFLNAGFSIIALATIQLVIGALNSLVIYRYAKKLLKDEEIPYVFTRSNLKDRFPVIKKLYNYSLYVLINNLGQKAIFYTDALVIGALSSVVSVTFYAIAGNLIEYLRRLIMMSNSVLNPVASEMDASNDTESINKLLINGSKLSLIIAIPICVVFLMVGDLFIGIWMGEEYMERSSVVLYILTVGTLLAIPHTTISSLLYGINKHRIIARLRIYEAISNLVLSVILIYYLGIAGVALGTAIPQFVFMVIILPLLTNKVISFDFKEYIVNVYILPFATCIPFAISIYLVSNNFEISSLIMFFIWILILLPVYAGSVFLICFNKSEKVLILSYLNKLGMNRLLYRK